MALPWTASRIGAVHLLKAKNFKEKGEKTLLPSYWYYNYRIKMEREEILKKKEELL